jgi:hypothetical protein
VDGKKYDNVLYVKDDDGSFYKVYRQMGGGGLLTAEKAEKISEDSYNKATSGKETRTFCNYAVRSVADKFGVSETFAKPEECANVMCQKLAAGKYDTKDYRFRAVKWKEAERYASDGGFVVGAWDGSKDSTYGHVFVVTGGYDGEVAVNRLYVFHADAIKLNGMHNFGETHLGLALPHNQIKSVNYYVWESR